MVIALLQPPPCAFWAIAMERTHRRRHPVHPPGGAQAPSYHPTFMRMLDLRSGRELTSYSRSHPASLVMARQHGMEALPALYHRFPLPYKICCMLTGIVGYELDVPCLCDSNDTLFPGHQALSGILPPSVPVV